MKGEDFSGQPHKEAPLLRRIAEIQHELAELRAMVDANYHLISPDGNDLSDYAQNITETITELETELTELQARSETLDSVSEITTDSNGDLHSLTEAELFATIKELREKIRSKHIQSDTDTHALQDQLERAEEQLKKL